MIDRDSYEVVWVDADAGILRVATRADRNAVFIVELFREGWVRVSVAVKDEASVHRVDRTEALRAEQRAFASTLRRELPRGPG